MNKYIPEKWLDEAPMDRIITHWTGGLSIPSSGDLAHYHILIDASGRVYKGIPDIRLNARPLKKGYAEHVRKCNTGSIGVALCGMHGAIENPFYAGKYPITAHQWDVAAAVIAELCRAYHIPVAPETVLTHAEVQPTLKIPQKGKWDIIRLPFCPDLSGARPVGDDLRTRVTEVWKTI